MKSPLISLFWLLFIGGIVSYFWTTSSVSYQAKDKLKEAYVAYVRGETARKVGERREAFNQALKLYTSLEEQFNPVLGDGKLYFNIANSYFQLEEYPMAVFYYYRALDLRPNDERVKSNLGIAQDRLGIQVKEDIPFLHYSFSLPEKLQIFFVFSFITIILFSLLIWYQKRWIRQLAIVSGFFSVVMLLILAYSYYFFPIEGIIVRSTDLYRDAGYQYAKVDEEPILSGNKVEVLEVLNEGTWLKIIAPNGHLGYIPNEAIRVL